MEIDLQKRGIGLNFNESGMATIRLWAPHAKQVSFLSAGGEYSCELTEQGLGYWFLQTDQIKPLEEYSFKISSIADNEILDRADPASLFQAQGPHGGSTAFDLNSFPWTDKNWKGKAMKDFIIYELHTGTFTPEGNLVSIETRLDHLLALGITAIEIMPLAQFPGTRNWGYDGVFPFAIHNTYGGPQALQHLVNACHAKGMAVILDVVYNHVGPEGNYFNDFGPYFTGKYNTPWGQAINFDDAGCDPVRHFFIENALMWFRDFHIDALRLDAVHAIKDFSPVHILSEIKTYTEKLSRLTGRSYNLIAELDLNDTRFIKSQKQQGYGMDGQWIDEFHHALRVSAGQKREGYYSDFHGVSELAKAYKDAYVYDGQYSFHRQKKFGIPVGDLPGSKFVVFSQNHDQVGNRMLGERSAQLVSFEMLKVMAAAVFCSPFLPLLFMGEEWAETNPFEYFVSHTDPDLIEKTRAGRKEEFADFHNNETIADPQSQGAFDRSKLDWEKLNRPLHKTMLGYYKTLIKLRKEYPALNHFDRACIETEGFVRENCLKLKRWNASQKIIALFNFSGQEQILPIQENLQDWSILLNSSSPVWMGPTPAPEERPTNGNIFIPSESVIILIKNNA